MCGGAVTFSLGETASGDRGPGPAKLNLVKICVRAKNIWPSKQSEAKPGGGGCLWHQVG